MRQWPRKRDSYLHFRALGDIQTTETSPAHEGTPCSFLLWILTDKRFHSNLAIAPTCDTVSTYHITDNARDPQRGLSRATYLLKVSRRAAQPNEEES